MNKPCKKKIKHSYKNVIHEYDELEKIKKLCHRKSGVLIWLYSIEKNISWSSMPDLDDDIPKSLEKEFDLYLKNFRENQEADKKKRESEILMLIKSYQKVYDESRTQKAKDEIINEIQLLLKEKYGLDGRADRIASKASIKFNLSRDQLT